MLALIGRRKDECKLPLEVISQFHSICSFACIEHTNAANQSSISRPSVATQHPQCCPGCWPVCAGKHPEQFCGMNTVTALLVAQGFCLPGGCCLPLCKSQHLLLGMQPSPTLTQGFSFKAIIQREQSLNRTKHAVPPPSSQHLFLFR